MESWGSEAKRNRIMLNLFLREGCRSTGEVIALSVSAAPAGTPLERPSGVRGRSRLDAVATGARSGDSERLGDGSPVAGRSRGTCSL